MYQQTPPKDPKRWKRLFKIVLFWFVFFIFVCILFIINWSRIRTNMENALKPNWFKSRSEQDSVGKVISPLPDVFEEESLLSLEDALDSLFEAQGLEPLGSPGTVFGENGASGNVQSLNQLNPGSQESSANRSGSSGSIQTTAPPASSQVLPSNPELPVNHVSSVSTGPLVSPVSASKPSSNQSVSQSLPTEPIQPLASANPPASQPVVAPASVPQSFPSSPNQGSQPVSAARESASTVSQSSVTQSSSPDASPVRSNPIVTRDRALYFIELDRGGAILRVKVSRTISSSDVPLLDVLQALLAGPTPEEQRRGIRSLMPQETKVLSVTTRRETAYINFSEEFQYNVFGVEGYAAQLNQIIWTVTEFANIKDVQILIEGRRIDYLGEGIWIGSPLSRDMF
jgi:spore germination protein GerM